MPCFLMLNAWKHASSDPDESRHSVSQVLRRHRLCLKGPAQGFRAEIDHLGDARLSLTRLSYGSAVDVEPEPEPGSWVISLPLRGRVDVLTTDAHVRTGPGLASMIRSDLRVRGVWGAGARQAVFRLRQDVMAEAADLLGAVIDPYKTRRPFGLVIGPQLGVFPGLLASVIGLDLDRCVSVPPGMLELQWNTLTDMLAQAAVGALTSGDVPLQPSSNDSAQRRLLETDAWLMDAVQRHDAPDVHALAAHLGLSLRSLQQLVRKHRGMTAYQLIEQARLRHARRLLRASSMNVSEVALACGFAHFGRFAAKYATTFGLVPGREGRGV